MLWHKLLLQVQDGLSDGYLRQQDSGCAYARWLLQKLLDDPASGNPDAAGPNVAALTAEYRKLRGVMTHEEHCALLYPPAEKTQELAAENADLRKQLQALLARMGG